MWRSLRTIRSIPRIKDIALILGKHGFHQVAGALRTPLRAPLRRFFRRDVGHVIQQPERLRLALEELGPTFIKFGQFLSTRPDLLPAEYIEELSKLQDEVRPAPFEEIAHAIEDELGAPVSSRFRSIDAEPLASASIAQVHRATTLGGEEVVVKVRKRGVERVVRQDLQVLGLLAEFLAGWRAFQHFDPEGVVRLFERSLQRELNFDYERYNILRMRENLGAASRIYAPRVYPELCRRGVLTMEYLRGEKLSILRQKPLDPAAGRSLALEIALGLLRQVFEHGFYHADPHPGNFILMADGRVGLIDFGNVGRVTREMKEDLLYLLVAILRRNYRNLSRWVIKRGGAARGIDPNLLALELMDALEPYHGLRLEDVQLGELLNALFALVLRHGISVPAAYVHAARVFVSLESVVRLSAPSLELVPALEPYVASLLKSRWDPQRIVRDLEADLSEILAAVKSCPANLSEVLAQAAEGKFRLGAEVTGMEALGQRLEHASSRVQLAVLSSGLLISAAILFTQAFEAGPLPRALGIAASVAAIIFILRLVVRGV